MLFIPQRGPSPSGTIKLAVTSTLSNLRRMTLTELREMARGKDIVGYSRLKKQDLILRLLRSQAEEQGFIFGGGVLEIMSDGIGFLRSEHLLPGAG